MQAAMVNAATSVMAVAKADARVAVKGVAMAVAEVAMAAVGNAAKAPTVKSGLRAKGAAEAKHAVKTAVKVVVKAATNCVNALSVQQVNAPRVKAVAKVAKSNAQTTALTKTKAPLS